MTKEEALKERPCYKCKHYIACTIRSTVFNPCKDDDEDYHKGFVYNPDWNRDNPES